MPDTFLLFALIDLKSLSERRLHSVFVIVTIAVIIHDKREPVKALSWIIVISLLPVVGFVFYIVFGRNHRKQKLFNRKELQRSGADRCAEPATDIRDQSSVAVLHKSGDQRSPRYHYAAAQQQQGVADRAQPRPGAERRGGDVRRDTPGAAVRPASRSIWNTTSSRTTSWAARSPTS